MKFFMMLAAIVFSFSSFSQDQFGKLCFNHGQCQVEYGVVDETRCLKIRTGIDYNGNRTCTIRCYNLPVGYFCKKLRDDQGVCKRESYKMPTLDPANPDCSDAVYPPLF